MGSLSSCCSVCAGAAGADVGCDLGHESRGRPHGGRQASAIEGIIETGTRPGDLASALCTPLRGAGAGPGAPAARTRTLKSVCAWRSCNPRAKSRYLAQLDGLVSYVESPPSWRTKRRASNSCRPCARLARRGRGKTPAACDWAPSCRSRKRMSRPAQARLPDPAQMRPPNGGSPA